MLVIRNVQMRAFAEAAREQFAGRAVAHLQKVLPEECTELGDGAVRDSVDLAIERAQSHGIEEEADVLQYLNLMYILGFDFDTDPELPWAKELLRDPDLDSASKVELLWDRVEAEAGGEEEPVG